MARKKITLLHSNDMHGDFLPKEINGISTGGLSRLSAYIKKTRSEEKNTIYSIAGDMFRGSIIDSEYMGLSTIELINVLEPDIATIGNHEVDYGLAHLLFLEKCATFPIINANMFVTMNNARLFTPFYNIEVDGIRILFIGILTEEVLASTKQEKIIGTFVDIEEAAKEIGIICDNYRTKNTDITVLLTHIGIEEDRKLASLLSKDFGVNMIIGGHSHTLMDEMEIVNDIPIVQAGTGTGIIGRFDILYDTWSKKIVKLDWRCDEINEHTIGNDDVMDQILSHYQHQTDIKYKRIVSHLQRELTHPARNQETEMGNLYADMLQDESSFDIMFMGSGSIRKQSIGPIIDYQTLIENTPFDDSLWMVKVRGDQLRRMIQFILRDEAWEGHTEFYQFSKGFKITYRKSTHTIEKLQLNGKDIHDGESYLIALQNYHYVNFDEFLGVPLEEVKSNMKPKVIATSVNNIFEEYLATHHGLDAHVEGRIEIIE